jgi:hypothetical protein
LSNSGRPTGGHNVEVVMGNAVDNMLARLEFDKLCRQQRSKVTVAIPLSLLQRIDLVRARMAEDLSAIGQSDLVNSCLDDGLSMLERRLGMKIGGERTISGVTGESEAKRRPYTKRPKVVAGQATPPDQPPPPADPAHPAEGPTPC